jgi:hypothetical protein
VTVEDCKIILKVHICGAESVGKQETAMALLEVLCQIDAQIAQERAGADSPPHVPAKATRTRQ